METPAIKIGAEREITTLQMYVFSCLSYLAGA